MKIEVPEAPDMSLPDPVIVINSNEASYFLDACEAFRFAGEEGHSTLEEVRQNYPGLSQDDACNFNIYGWTLQGWLNFESKMAELAGYVETLRSHIQFLENQMDARYKLMKERDDKLQDGEQHEQRIDYQ
ncbi:hypothetical protein [Alteromonas halophila]|uniref:Uncharacterized protein n=1 Tax=Alteromonas halophila TaxID=516698 RepID=A0A918N080_9ALTE|nr:hypothetical protein [Alteromonas halophila]GGW88592.1 hypothetical protein GCM10007391_23370 [Alteromonas halophila]